MASPGQASVPTGLARVFLEDLLQGTYLRVRGYMALHDVSGTLQAALETSVTTETTGSLVLPYFWAEFVHNGRGRVSAAGKKFLIYFPNKFDDPRTNFAKAYPRTKGGRIGLSQADLERFDEINKERRRLKQPPIMVMAKSVGPVASKPFYVEGLRNFPQPFDLVRIVERLNKAVAKIAPNGTKRMVVRL